ncbi:unnamed protein product [Cyprideis torosa]|uniref:Uncharacterized protein n=1 Tax=Cyprideis torosa TaxID=163714 RepID=A0A7R8ZX19_9CRUS|nr:unnamed protein product [Cyprideis torosa]CAG0906037.1 unnamed protein product [Cyprideis torosa]
MKFPKKCYEEHLNHTGNFPLYEDPSLYHCFEQGEGEDRCVTMEGDSRSPVYCHVTDGTGRVDAVLYGPVSFGYYPEDANGLTIMAEKMTYTSNPQIHADWIRKNNEAVNYSDVLNWNIHFE